MVVSTGGIIKVSFHCRSELILAVLNFHSKFRCQENQNSKYNQTGVLDVGMIFLNVEFSKEISCHSRVTKY